MIRNHKRSFLGGWFFRTDLMKAQLDHMKRIYFYTYILDGFTRNASRDPGARFSFHDTGGHGLMADEKQQPTVADPHDMAAKRQLHERADEKNVIDVRHGRPVLCCGARKKKGDGLCKALAGMGTDHPGYGRCKFCGGLSTGARTPEGRARTTESVRKHGFYSTVLNERERAAYEGQLDEQSIGLQHEIYVLKAKILVYLENWRDKWDTYYRQKLNERKTKWCCSSDSCEGFVVRSESEGAPGYCIRCGHARMIQEKTWTTTHTHEEATEYADRMSKVYYSEGEGGGRSYYHAGTIEDRALDRALNTLSRLIEKHARLTQGDDDDVLAKINRDLQAASRGRVSISWGGKAQARKAADA